ncbi:SDR family oxidoreductase [Profundibacterium mesophilum]|uniref:3-oxoacyl-acyl-carrier protein reductase n=1 Tax=Profundibacterium mesophilum KAUST100406-0324 TaxID=1037889 RepID=A0A921TD37_9RHOB|nr:SDR family NAD(P)-dependent oxidoreductase [Profundibacterium mesophilum]KAF0675702.1 3-oxoacyl-acyl-carrier protein reductase [Profundibacterium mesophilum KAUST100406-0324]
MFKPTILITGASSGIGAATARAAAGAGWNVAMLARRADRLDALVGEIGDAALSLQGDVTDLAGLEAATARCEEHFGRLDAAFANAGMGLQTAGTQKGDPEEWRRLVEVNVMGVLYTTRAVLPALRRSKGTLVMTGSAAGRQHIKGSIYGASKWFVHGYAGNMADEMREWGGRCCVIAPGMVDTEFFDEGKPDKLHPEDVAASVLHAITAGPRAAIQEIYVMPTG